MMALWMAIFFAVTAAAAWLVLFPAARDSVVAGADRLFARLAAVLGRWQSRASGRASESSQSARASGQRAMRLFGRHRNLMLATAVLLTVPPLVILQLRQRVVLDGFEGGTAVASNNHVLGLLRGERLAPPPELPPAVFVAAEAELLRSAGGATSVIETPQAISGADRKWNRIDPVFQQRVLAIYQVMREQYGYEMVLIEGYRSPERQAALARKGATTTRAGAGQSCHQYGLAVDSALYRDGKLQWDMGDAWTKRGYFLYGRLASEAGLEWGGNWRSIKDYVHLELKDACRQARRAAGH